MSLDHTPKYPVQTLEKSLDILNLLANNAGEQNGLGISEISKALSIGKSTIHRILDTLMAYRYVEKCEETSRYRLGWGIYKVASSVIEQHDVSSMNFDLLSDLCDKYSESVNIGVLNKNSVVIIHKNDPDTTLKVNRQVGEHEPIYATALGKVLVCEFSKVKLQNLVEAIDFRPYTGHTVTSAEVLLNQLEQIRDQNFAMDEEEYCLGLTCIACPIRDRSGKIVAALSMSGPTVRMNFNKIISIKEEMQSVCAKLSEQLGMNQLKE